jgi:hypothetical protein
MLNTDTQNISPAAVMADGLKSWVMIILSFIFIFAYVTVLIVDWINGAKGADVIKELQPIVFGIIGYYFGRLPAQQNENALKETISHESAKKDEALEGKAAAEGKMDAAKIALGSTASESSITGVGPITAVPDRNAIAIAIAMKIMNS